MSEEPKIIDGADRRKKRLLDMLAYIDNKKGATSNDIKSFMLVKHGLKYKTSAEYIQELHLSGLINLENTKWHTTAMFRRLASQLY